jgi:hypothetical protein
LTVRFRIESGRGGRVKKREDGLVHASLIEGGQQSQEIGHERLVGAQVVEDVFDPQ